MSNELFNKLAFNGFHVTYYNHESRVVEKKIFPTYDSVMDRGWRESGEPFPTAQIFAEDLFDVFGDVVGEVKDNAGNVLYDNMLEMNEAYESISNWP